MHLYLENISRKLSHYFYPYTMSIMHYRTAIKRVKKMVALDQNASRALKYSEINFFL